MRGSSATSSLSKKRGKNYLLKNTSEVHRNCVGKHQTFKKTKKITLVLRPKWQLFLRKQKYSVKKYWKQVRWTHVFFSLSLVCLANIDGKVLYTVFLTCSYWCTQFLKETTWLFSRRYLKKNSLPLFAAANISCNVFNFIN